MDEHDRIAPPRIDPTKTPFTETEAFRRYGFHDDPNPDSPESLYLKAIIEEQAFDQLPYLVTRRELDRYIAAGEVELFRGVTEARFADELRAGAYFVGRGGVFDGMYAASGVDALSIARTYASPLGAIIRMSLKVGAQVADGRTFEDQVTAALRRAEVEGGQSLAVMRLIYNEVSSFAVYLGYDAIRIVEFPEVDNYAILNRSAIRVQRENIR
ncbi:MAG: hypothetical protein ACRDJE_15945 [Dehalococcoidia bacterium]